jgi:hypothetical protein
VRRDEKTEMWKRQERDTGERRDKVHYERDKRKGERG